jgi:hypothetical protein
MANRISTKAELSFYGFSKPQINRPRWNTIANQLGVRPTTQRYANITDNSNKQSKVYKDFVKAVKTGIQQKYTFDNQVIIQQFSFGYKIRFKEDKGRWGKWFPKTANLQVQGRRFGLFESIQQSQQDEINRLEESNAEIKDITEPVLGDPVIVPIVGGKLVAKGVRVARMRKAGAFLLDADFIGDASWDRNENTCVFDYLFHKYAGKSGFKKTLPADDRERAYDNLETIFDCEDYNNSLENGVNTEQLLKFCEKFDVSMYAFDKNEKLIHYYRSKNSKYSALIYLVSNEHFYPVEAEEKRKSICAKNREADKPDEEKKNWKSDDFAFENIAGKEKDYQVVYPPKCECKKNCSCITGNEFALKIILEKNTLPNPKSLRVDENTIISFQLGDTLYLTERPEKEVLKYCGDDFKGQSVNSLLMETWKEVDEVDEEDETPMVQITSRVNPLVHKTLTEQNVKYRTHYGATRDLKQSELFDTLPPMSINMKYVVLEKKTYKNIFTGEPITETKEVMKTHRVVFPPKKRYEQNLIDGGMIALDINKCYATCLKNPYDDWIRFDLEDTWEDYDGELKTGLYFVETDDLTLLHKTNIYSNKILEKAVAENIPIVIKKQLVHKVKSFTEKPIPRNHFDALIQAIKEQNKGIWNKDDGWIKNNTSLGKLMINMITGYLGKTDKIDRTAELDTDAEQVWRHYLACERPDNEADFERYFFHQEFIENNYTRFHKDNIILKTLEAGDKNLFLYGYESRTCLNEYTLPMYLQILDWSNIRLYELGKKVGGEIIYRHTDLVISLGGKLPTRELTNCWGDYSVEVKKFNFESVMKTDRAINISEFGEDWKHNPQFKNSSDWSDIIKYAIDNGGLLIEGRAGTGKSFIPKSAFASKVLKLDDEASVDEYGKETKSYANTKTMSFTNKASRGIMGTTIHKTFHITSAGTIPRKTMNGLKKYKYFVIDEIGMISNELWKYLMLLKKSNPRAVFILLGDWRQLPPIDEGRTAPSDIFNHPVVKFLCNNNKIELTEKQRYDQQLWDFLEKGCEEGVWEGLAEEEVSCDDIYTSKSICFLNRTRVDINKRCMDYFKSQTDEFMFLEYTPKKIERKIGETITMVDDPKDRRQPVYLYVGLPVMCWKNTTELGIVNSEEFMVSWFDEEKIVLSRDEGGDDVEIDTTDFHNYFLANYASTAHKSQGATYKGKVILWDFDRMAEDKKLCYTACSRATALENLVIATGLK